MSLDSMKQDVAARGATVFCIQAADGDGVTADQPALLEFPSFALITTLSSLDKVETDQACAHELAHILVCFNGLVMVAAENQDAGDLAVAIGNTISHPWVLLIAEQYGMPNDLHLARRQAILTSFPSESDLAACNRYSRYAIGVNLFDLAQTIPSLSADAEACSHRDPLVAQAFEAASKQLTKLMVRPDTPGEAQRACIEQFLRSLGCDGLVAFTTIEEVLGL